MKEFSLNDQEYSKVLDHIVVGCVDVAVVNGDEILLERRKNDPISGHWWIFGGRILVGETLQATAQRQVRRELNLEIIDGYRFKEIGTFNLQWPTRRESPSANGAHHLLVAHMIELDDQERQSLEPKLFERDNAIQWMEIDRPREFLLPEMHSILQHIQIYRSQEASVHNFAV